jgi:hypothetical protein
MTWSRLVRSTKVYVSWMLVCTSLFGLTDATSMDSLLLLPSEAIDNGDDLEYNTVDDDLEYNTLQRIRTILDLEQELTMSNEETNENDVEPIGKKH